MPTRLRIGISLLAGVVPMLVVTPAAWAQG